MYFDSHCHLNHPAFDDDLSDVLIRASAAGVTGYMVPGYDWPSSQRAIRLSQDSPKIFAAAGIHPYAADQLNDQTKTDLSTLYHQKKVRAVGEIGLDFSGRGYPEPPVQAECLSWHLGQAERCDLPVIIHQRESAGAIAEQLTGRRLRGVMHCWSLGEAELGSFLDAGLHISFAGLLTYRSAPQTRAAAQAVPIERLLIETDSPYMVPRRAKTGRRNQPSNITYTATLLAGLREIDTTDLARQTSENATALFGAGPT